MDVQNLQVKPESALNGIAGHQCKKEVNTSNHNAGVQALQH